MLYLGYRPGDQIVLKPRTRGSLQPQETARIVALQPETRGPMRYRVRVQGEQFDRSIGKDDIDTEASTTATAVSEANNASTRKAGSSWIDMSRLRSKR